MEPTHDLEGVNHAIDEAKNAARRAGIDIDALATVPSSADSGNAGKTRSSAHSTNATTARADSSARRGRGARTTGHRGLTSLAYSVKGLESAVHATTLQHALNSINGVESTVVYGTKSIWLSVPDTFDIAHLDAVFQEHGVEAWMTDSTLRRRTKRMEQPTIPRARRNVAAHRRAWAAAERMKRQNYGHIFATSRLPFDSTEVLFTARELITRSRLIVAIVLGMAVIALQCFPALQVDYWQWACLALSTPVVLWSAWPFHRALLGGLRRGMSALDSASSVAIVVAYLFSLAELLFSEVGELGWKSHRGLQGAAWWDIAPSTAQDALQGSVHTGCLFFDVACGTTIVLLIARIMSQRSDRRSKNLLHVLSVPASDRVTVVRKNKKGEVQKKDISVGEIRTGDDIIIAPGMVVPCDAEVISGKSSVDMGPVGGRGSRRDISVGDMIYAGARNYSAPLKCRAAKTGSKTRLASMQRWVWDAARDENRLAQLSTRSASVLVPWAVVIASLALSLWWLVTSSVESAVSVALSVLVTIAPVALAVSAPLALRLGLWRAATEGALLHDTTTIHTLAEVESVVFNRVGTLTHGPMQVIGITPGQGENPDLVLRVASALLMESTHPVSTAIVRADREARDANSSGGEIPNWLDVGEVTITDGGVFEASVEIPFDGEMRHVSARVWRPRGIGELSEGRLAAAAESGGSPIVVSWRGRDRGVISLTDTLKDDAPAAIDRLEELGLETFMLSRDPYPVARKLADSMGMSTVLAGIAPNRKEATVRALHAQGVSVAMVGDQDVLGALRVADVGILMGSADRVDAVAREVDRAADVVLLRDDVQALPDLVNLLRHIRNTVDWNIWLSWSYNVVALVLAVCGVLHPLVASLCMLGVSALIQWRSSRIATPSYAAHVLRSTHMWQSWWSRVREERELRQQRGRGETAHTQHASSVLHGSSAQHAQGVAESA